MPSVTVSSSAELLDRARALASRGERRILGITGAPGAGKSTLAEAIVDGLDDLAVCVPMDGYHLPNEELRRLGLRDRKGAPETFDADAYIELLRRLRAAREPVTYAPVFRRDLEASVADAIAVPRDIPLVVTEGNYLLLDEGAWSEIRALLDEAWFLEPDDAQRVPRLIQRHIEFGKPEATATDWVMRSDEANARLIAPTRARADVVVSGWVDRSGCSQSVET